MQQKAIVRIKFKCHLPLKAVVNLRSTDINY